MLEASHRRQQELEFRKQMALRTLRKLSEHPDPEVAHHLADGFLLSVIADERITDAYEAVQKYYS